MYSARGVAAIVFSCRNSSCNSSCDAIVRSGQQFETIALFRPFRVQSFICNSSCEGTFQTCFKQVAAASVAIALADFTPAPRTCKKNECFKNPARKIKDHACNKSVSYGSCVNWRSLSSVSWERKTDNRNTFKLEFAVPGTIWGRLSGTSDTFRPDFPHKLL